MGLLTPLAIKIGSYPRMSEYLPTIVKADDLIQKVSGGSRCLLQIAGLPSVTMTVVGRKSGQPRTTTLLAVPDGDDWLITGSYFGGPKAPAWVFNVRAAGTVTIRGIEFSAVELSGDARASAWETLRAVWPNFDLYEQRTERVIPVFRLSPRP
ncbi:nitroreductase family deazaflavin-dependent oxidoreductase [Gordonia sp. HY442]|uniref:nitroreductase family deazaflavin-dependent oxidoreductase n=1 Tax=Gordonia zhenghanii TaxID=2911516 RepID=UPI001F480935|nr:nitroreductase family deazaflavin-dependent oxidoreductase [Gordonia zhenghanii]MCF8607443.1 nitroreductase family deazaflavin-dependent oxidoreductase [Gordonia zhenghanii]